MILLDHPFLTFCGFALAFTGLGFWLAWVLLCRRINVWKERCELYRMGLR